MDKNRLIEIALIEWTARFRGSSKKTKDARANFEDLFQKWKDLGATFDELYDVYLPKAIKTHQPLHSVARNVYKHISNKMGKTEKEFIDEWNDAIESAGQEAFFEFFPATPIDHDPEPKVYGSMSATEYKAQRRYAEQFPILNTDELVKQWREQQEYNLDVEKVLENVLGDQDETES